ncbi:MULTISPECIES: hypothetical protein [Acidobacteriaceae]|uniref:hypothetical protein n=1 Tax=Acidobacteriaceae TaxID=204434 RepID=UPI001C205FFF|nr:MULTISPECIES: hypothetical protein [Acidobacteriaceae]MDW5266752.1 hypothetical protein [Edaphobacter sp.]
MQDKPVGARGAARPGQSDRNVHPLARRNDPVVTASPNHRTVTRSFDRIPTDERTQL